MKKYKIYFENENIISAWVDAESHIDALRKVYTYFNSIAGGFKNLCYTVAIDSKSNITLCTDQSIYAQ